MDGVSSQMVGPRRKRDPFDRERLADIAFRKKCAKNKGRNHWRNWERRKMAVEAKRMALAKLVKTQSAVTRYHAEVRAFWSGDREAHPMAPRHL